MTPPVIKQPKNAKSGATSLTWNTLFQNKWQGRYTKAQKFVDSEVLRLSDRYIPLLTGVLKNSGILNTKIGSGLVVWATPYARKQYYSPRAPGSQTGALRGPFWFERMKQVFGRTIIAGAKKIAGTGKK